MADTKLIKRDPEVERLQKRNADDIDYHLKEWTSGKRGGGHVPADFGWGTNPKQYQEENGSSALRVPAELLRQEASGEK